MSNEFAIRKIRASDWAFIISSYVRSSRKHYRIKESIFYSHFPILAERRVTECEVLVAVGLEDDSHILGFIVYSGDVCHWVYTKQILRGHGVAKALFNTAQGDGKFTQTTALCPTFLHFNPFI